MRLHAALSVLVVLVPARGWAEPVPPAPGEHEPTIAHSNVIEYETIIEAAPAPLPATATARDVDAGAISAASRHTGDYLLRLVPGLYLSAHGAEGKGQQIFLRGFDAVHGADLEVRVAGVPINEMSNVHGQGYVDLGLVIPEVV